MEDWGRKVGEVKLNLFRWNRAVTALLIALLPGLIFLTYLLRPFQVHRGILVLASVFVLFASAFIHEGLHGLAALALGIPRRELHFEFGLSLSYCHPRRPMPLASYRIFLLFPSLVMLPALGLVWALTLHWLVASALAINLAGGLVDVVTFWRLRSYPGNLTAVVDPSQPGCDLYGFTSGYGPPAG